MVKAGFRGGVHPDDRKSATAGLPVTRAGVPDRIVIPMSQHLGAPCEPSVAVGDRVERGRIVGDIRAMVSAPVHSPVNGTVTAIVDVLLAGGTRSAAVEIEPDAEQDFESWLPVTETETMELACAAGLVGMGGAAFPTRVKLRPPADMPISCVILNGCECEPFLTCDHRVMLEKAEAVVGGGRKIAEIVGAKRVVIGVEDNKPDAIAALREHAGGDVEVLALATRYPQGAEKQLILAALGKEVPHGKLPAATGALVHNVGTAAALWEAYQLKKPLMERVVTVSGAVARPGNYLTLVGTPISALLETAGGVTEEQVRVIAGGPMTGAALGSLDVPVVKGTSGVVVLRMSESAPAVDGDQPCIRCGRCRDACPMYLLPYELGTQANVRLWDGCERLHALDCIECGCCAYACPTRRPLVQLIRGSKAALMARGAKL
ncbi:MAG: electron transport complex subunit RsxC [Coriobacteriaceae bacterium]|nr:electron transport complex subunit RsxC [Coriobacteriaceae bacterium]